MDRNGGDMIITYNKKRYDPINEKTIGDKTYSAYRCSTNPKNCIVVCGETIVETKDIKNIWPDNTKILELFQWQY